MPGSPVKREHGGVKRQAEVAAQVTQDAFGRFDQALVAKGPEKRVVPPLQQFDRDSGGSLPGFDRFGEVLESALEGRDDVAVVAEHQDHRVAGTMPPQGLEVQEVVRCFFHPTAGAPPRGKLIEAGQGFRNPLGGDKKDAGLPFNGRHIPVRVQHGCDQAGPAVRNAQYENPGWTV